MGQKASFDKGCIRRALRFTCATCSPLCFGVIVFHRQLVYAGWYAMDVKWPSPSGRQWEDEEMLGSQRCVLLIGLLALCFGTAWVGHYLVTTPFLRVCSVSWALAHFSLL